MRVTYSIRNFSLAARCFHPPTIPSSILHSHTVYHLPCTQHPAYMYEEYSLIFIPFVVVALFSAVGRRYKKKFRYCLCFMVCSVPSGLNGCSTHCPCNSCKPTPKSEWKKKTRATTEEYKKKITTTRIWSTAYSPQYECVFYDCIVIHTTYSSYEQKRGKRARAFVSKSCV